MNECAICGQEFFSNESISVITLQGTNNVRCHTDQRICLWNLLIEQKKLKKSVTYAHDKIQSLLEAQSTLQGVVSKLSGMK